MRKRTFLLLSVMLLITFLTACGEKPNTVCDSCHKEKYCHFYHIYSPFGEVKDYALCDGCYEGYELSVAMMGGTMEEYE